VSRQIHDLNNKLQEKDSDIRKLEATLHQICEEGRLEMEQVIQRIRELEDTNSDKLKVDSACCDKMKKLLGVVAAAGWWFLS
jgi:predicted RNase H-like nuclease (RuvC/YqgF family)